MCVTNEYDRQTDRQTDKLMVYTMLHYIVWPNTTKYIGLSSSNVSSPEMLLCY